MSQPNVSVDKTYLNCWKNIGSKSKVQHLKFLCHNLNQACILLILNVPLIASQDKFLIFFLNFGPCSAWVSYKLLSYKKKWVYAIGLDNVYPKCKKPKTLVSCMLNSVHTQIPACKLKLCILQNAGVGCHWCHMCQRCR